MADQENLGPEREDSRRHVTSLTPRSLRIGQAPPLAERRRRTGAEPNYPYRVFVTTASDDGHLAKAVEEQLRSLGSVPLLAANDLQGGEDFLKGIKERIRHSHMVMPILTKVSKARPWVNQEIGFALATGVPLIPICIGVEPEGLAEAKHALRFQDEDAFRRDLATKLKPGVLAKALGLFEQVDVPVYESAETADDRNAMFEKYLERANRYATEIAYEHEGAGRLRQQSAFSSFSIPSKWAKHDEWDQREGPQARSETARMMLRVEREELETRAGRYGCSLIIKPSIRAELHGDNGTRTRLELLATFLESMKELDNQVRVGIWPPDEPAFRNLTIVGDWFLADAVVPFGGGSYTKTLFTWHGPTVHRLIREFDELLDDLIGEMDTGGLSTREYAIQVIGQELDSLG